ncbi:MAG TPA: hypothetical protein PK253_00515 [Spirochaetota bacterium]|nr:hypothetical protein [Spirochaetota bacterium]
MISIIIPIMNYLRTINICSPGYNASCALCCGSHNYKALCGEISVLFQQRTESVDTYISLKQNFKNFSDDDYSSLLHAVSSCSLPKLHDDAIQCPFVGYVQSSSVIGCLIYPQSSSTDLRGKRLTGNTCKHFSCVAREVLTDEEIIFAASLMRDWYYYSLFINDIAFLKKTFIEYKHAENVTSDIIENIKEDLTTSLFEHVLIGK